MLSIHGDDSTGPPVSNFHFKDPKDETQKNQESNEPKYMSPSKDNAGEEESTLLQFKDHIIVPNGFKEYKVRSSEPKYMFPLFSTIADEYIPLEAAKLHIVSFDSGLGKSQ